MRLSFVPTCCPISCITDTCAVERRLTASPLISYALVIGAHRESTAALVIPSSPDVTIESLLPLIEELNASVSTQSRLNRQRVTVLQPSDTFVFAPKGTVIRGKTEAKYPAEIEAMYAEKSK